VHHDDRTRTIKKNLIALSTAALLAVYTAGYARTRAAAQRFASEDAERRPGVSPTPDTAGVDAVPPPQVATAKPIGLPARARDTSASGGTVAPAAPVATRSAVDSSAPTVAVTVLPAATPATDTTRPPISGQAIDSAAPAADRQRGQLKDGTYTGWGMSRHGDIEASVEIKNGRIIAATITQCLTRYSCSWIAGLPPQIIARQRADVDLVSGATQSTNAFYDAIVEALSKAK
jgi:uncharacterized protein with FMN-binding domain